jgi:hypothetical protein
VIVFDRPVPDDRISYVRDIENVDVPAIAYTTQEWTPENPTPLQTCGDTISGSVPVSSLDRQTCLCPPIGGSSDFSGE